MADILNPYSPKIRAKAEAMLRAGVPGGEISRQLGVARSTVSVWKKKTVPQNYVSSAQHDDRGEHLEAHRRDLDRNRRYWDARNVVLLGDPPLHRSALGRRMGLGQ
jgi:IS30 family transposase